MLVNFVRTRATRKFDSTTIELTKVRDEYQLERKLEPESIDNLRPPGQLGTKRYVLASVIRHHGLSVSNGHYTTCSQHSKKKDGWKIFDDNHVISASRENILSSSDNRRDCCIVAYTSGSIPRNSATIEFDEVFLPSNTKPSKSRSAKRKALGDLTNSAFVPGEESEFEDVAAEESDYEDVAALSRKKKTRKKKKSISSGQVEQANKKKKRKKNTAGKAIDGKINAKPSLGNDAKCELSFRCLLIYYVICIHELINTLTTIATSADKSNADDGDDVDMPIPVVFGGERSDELLNTLYQQGYSSRLMIGDGSCFPSGLCEHFRLMGINLTSSELRKRMLDWIRIEYEKGEASDEYMAKMGGSGYFDEFEIQLVVNHLRELIGYHLSLCIVTLDESGNLEERWVDPMIEGESVRQQKHLYFSLHNPMSSDFCHYNNITSVPNQEQQRAIPYTVQVNEATLPTVDENVDTSEVDGDDEAILPTVDENVDSTSEVDGDDDAMADRIDRSHDFENLVHTLEGNSDMDIRSKQILQYFDEFIDSCRRREVPVDDIKWFKPCVPKKLKNDKLLMKLLHYCPTTGKFM